MKPRNEFELKIKLDEHGKPQTFTRNDGLSYDVIVAALSQQLHLYNNIWAKRSSTTFEEK